jgi:hypothetical protein
LPPLGYVDLIRQKYPQFPATQPLGIPVDLAEASRLILDAPIYLGPRGDLWITHADAPPTPDVLVNANDEQVHVTRELVRFVFWTNNGDSGWKAHVISESPDGSHEHVSAEGRNGIAPQRSFNWSRAFQWNDRVVVPTDTGISLLDFRTMPATEHFHSLVESASPELARPRMMLDSRGLLAWIPWESGKTGSVGASRFVDERWVRLDASAQWPEKLLHLVPLLDGSVMQIIAGDDGAVELQVATLDAAAVDEAQVADLVTQMSDPDEEIRVAAFTELTRYGPGLWPVLEEMAGDQPAEVRVRLGQLMGNRVKPTLGGMSLIDGKMRLVSHYRDGGALFYAAGGVSVPKADGGEEYVTPAWISCRPGRPTALLPHALVNEVNPDTFIIEPIAGEWLLIDPILGPRRFMGNHFVSLLREEELTFNRPIGFDRRGRWLFANDHSNLTLIVDPTLPDPTPRLPVWAMTIAGGSVGWTEADWPVIRKSSSWALETEGWRSLDDKKEKTLTEAADEDQTLKTGPTTGPTTAESLGKALCIDDHQCTFYDGRNEIVRVDAKGVKTVWPLPSETAGSDEYTPVLVPADGSLFLFNAAGRVIQIDESKGESPFVIRATFTHDIPNTDAPTRIWRDPAGRINVVYDGNELAILFPNAKIPGAIRTLMPATEE